MAAICPKTSCHARRHGAFVDGADQIGYERIMTFSGTTRKTIRRRR
ncbi:hypothetical protein CcrC1_gp395c [Caulobacter phage C1]|nr:hypothetical protein CcrC1_gp395c [Caulobacter phage C1]UTU08624.1 hypothetical protein CcrC2_gp396c [Caulobacter phage C2]UTU09139.1 hypothetical protein CcrJ4_gp390c [Caulobacter phage J4]WGN97809.1 hypothetical protein [Bertelyvirus sp.]